MRDGWKRVRLDDAAEVTIGRQRSPRHATGSHVVPYMRAANVKDGALQLDDVLAMNFTPDEQAVYALRSGDVLVTEGCGSIRELGASARWAGNLPGVVCFQNTLLRLRARAGVALPEFVEQWARWAHAAGIWAGVGSGTNIFHIGVQRAREVPIDLPPLAEQRRIVDLLKAVDLAAMAADRAHACAERFMEHTVGYAVATSRSSISLGELAQIRGGKRLPKGTPWSPHETSHPYIRVLDIRDGQIEASDLVFVPDEIWPAIKRYVVKAEDVIVSIVGTIGEVARVPPELDGANLTENAALIRIHDQQRMPASLLSSLLRSAAGQAEITRLTVGTTQKKLALFRIAQIEVPEIAPEAQASLIQLLGAAEDDARAAARVRQGLHALRRALIGDLLRGVHDVPDSYDALLESA